MGEYLHDAPLAAAHKNLVVDAAGNVFANYLLRGINMNPYKPTTISTAQEQNILLFEALSHMPTTDVYLAGIKARKNPDDTANAIVRGIKKITDGTHADLIDRARTVHGHLKYGMINEYERVYLLSVKIPTGLSSGAKAMAKAGKSDVLAKLDWSEWDRYQQQFIQKIPRSFYRDVPALLAGPEHLTWIHDRMRLRGLDVPMLPSRNLDRFNPHAFGSMMINKAADSTPLFDEFLDRTAKGYTPKATTNRVRQYLRNFQSMRMGTMLAVYSPEERTDALPDGPASMQSFLAVCGYPTKSRVTLNTFTSLVDRDLGVDADFALRMHFSQDDISVEQQRRFDNTVDSEAAANATDRHDAADYTARKAEREALKVQSASESGARGIAVAAIFALANPDPEKLRQATQEVKSKLTARDFAVIVPPGGQYDLLKQMMPCVPTSDLVNDLKGGTTVRKFAACLPIRRTEVGDSVGIPFAINMENALNQVILLDLLGSTDKGSGSMAFSGAQGSGKSFELKTLIEWLGLMRRPRTIFDQSDSREYLTFARSQGDCQVVEALAPMVSMDPLKMFADDPGFAKTVFLEIAEILMGLTPDSPEMLLLSEILKPEVRKGYKITSSRRLLELLRAGKWAEVPGNTRLRDSLGFWAGQEYSSALFDPVDAAGRVTELPAFRRAEDSTAVVFVTRGLPMLQGPLTSSTPALARYSVALHTLMAWSTTRDFSRIDGLCALIADEVSFWSGSSVLTKLIGEPDKTGRKEQNIVIVAGQLGKHMGDDAYDLIRRKAALRQETAKNAAAALEWADIPPTGKLVQRMVSDTSPGDPDNNNIPIKGREGEGWYNDGFGNVARIRLLGSFSQTTRRWADTTSSTMIRQRDIERGNVTDDGRLVRQ